MTTQSLSIATAVDATSPQDTLYRLLFGASVTQAIYVAAKLGIADYLAEGLVPVSELACKTGTHQQSLYRLLRVLSGFGIFRETDPRVFELTSTGYALRSDSPNCYRNAAIFLGEEWLWQVWSRALYSVQTGKPAWENVHGAEAFNYFSTHPEHAEIFNRAMTDLTAGAAAAVADAYDFSGFRNIVDVAGGHGYLLAQILKSQPGLKGILFDLPSVIEGADALLKKEGVEQRVQKVSGDFFESVHKGADAYIIKHAIHDWDDHRAAGILRNIRSAMSTNSKLLIVEAVMPEDNEPHPGKVMDLSMLVLAGGTERTAEEYRRLLESVDLRITRIVPTRSPMSIIEALRIN